MKRVWAGEKLTESVCAVGPPPVQKGGRVRDVQAVKTTLFLQVKSRSENPPP